MDEKVELYRTADAISRIKYILEKYIKGVGESYIDEGGEEFKKSIELVIQSYERLAECNINLRENLPSWKEILLNIDFGKTIEGADDIVECVYFGYVCSKELIRENGSVKKASEALELIVKATDFLQKCSIGAVFKYRLNDCFYSYENSVKYKLIEERAVEKFESGLKYQVENELKIKSEEINYIKKRIKENVDILESIEGETGLVSLYSGMKEYANNTKEKIRKVRVELKNIKYLVFLTPVLSALIFLTVDVHYGFFLSTLSAMIVLGYYWKVLLRKEDQYEQLLSKVENKIALVIFHRSHIGEMDDGESVIANEKFHSLLYRDLETNEWNAPDLSESLAELIRAIKK